MVNDEGIPCVEKSFENSSLPPPSSFRQRVKTKVNTLDLISVLSAKPPVGPLSDKI
jgi:hypothetical protein